MRKTLIHLPIAFGVEEAGRKVKIPTNLPIYFPLGPIRNSLPWHGKLINRVVEKDAEVFVACPARPTELDIETLKLVEIDKPEYEMFPRQRAWENYYINRAMGLNEKEETGGCGHFHLGEKAPVEKHPGKSYAQITMVEFGEMIATVQFFKPDLRLIISYDSTFPELSTLLYELEEKIPHVPVMEGLEEGVDLALEIALNSARRMHK